MSTFGDTLRGIDAMNKEESMRETWGHLAPVKNKTYKGRIVWAIGIYDCGDLNPTALVCELGKLPDSPWFYDAVRDWLSNLPPQLRQPGCVYEFRGTFRNYKFKGVFFKLFDANIGTCTSVEADITMRCPYTYDCSPSKEESCVHFKVHGKCDVTRCQHFGKHKWTEECGDWCQPYKTRKKA